MSEPTERGRMAINAYTDAAGGLQDAAKAMQEANRKRFGGVTEALAKTLPKIDMTAARPAIDRLREAVDRVENLPPPQPVVHVPDVHVKTNEHIRQLVDAHTAQAEREQERHEAETALLLAISQHLEDLAKSSRGQTPWVAVAAISATLTLVATVILLWIAL